MKLKKLLILILMFVMATSAIFAQNNIAVSTFDIAGGAVSTEEAEAITELFIAELVSTGKVTVVDRANFDKIIKEMKFQASDWSNKEKTVALGNAVNATMVVRGQIIKLGSRMYLTSTIIDVKTASVLSSAREQFNSLDDIFGLLTNFAKKAVEGLYFKVGDIGPGGGIVFYVEGTRAYEVTANLGAYKWEEAKKVAKDYRGGGYDDWYLPTKSELNLVFQNLKKTGKIQDDTWHWSSSEYSSDRASCQRFFDGLQDCDGYKHVYYKTNTFSVRAVRAFNIE